jgi:hypothetical protein
MLLLHTFLVRFPYESSCFLVHNLLITFHAFELLRDVLMRFKLFDPKKISFMRFHALCYIIFS